jgi:4-aminobutyrate aminotransferase/(S)-3-amino-2-methylpropionate transaminase
MERLGKALGHAPPRMVVPPPGPASCKLARRLAAVESPAFEARRGARAKASGSSQAPIAYARARGSNVVDADGNVYVDLVAGFGALPLGHGAEAVDRAVRAQQRQVSLALGDVYATEAKVRLCERLARMMPGPTWRVLLGLSGADAVTAALKSCALATGRPRIVAFEGAYHGLSYAPLAACGYSPEFRRPFQAHLGRFVDFVAYPTTAKELDAAVAAVRRELRRGDVAGVLVEPILGRGGCVVPPDGFLAGLRRACDDAGSLLVVDEIWTGLGRSGALLACAAGGVTPDIVCLGKALGNGHAISACVGRPAVMSAWARHGGSAIHTATHFGAPLACAAALATLETLEKRDLARRSVRVGDDFQRAIRAAVRGRGVREVRGRGLMVGIDLEGGAERALRVSRALLERGYLVLTGGTRGDVLTLTPPLVVPTDLLERFVPALVAALR